MALIVSEGGFFGNLDHPNQHRSSSTLFAITFLLHLFLLFCTFHTHYHFLILPLHFYYYFTLVSIKLNYNKSTRLYLFDPYGDDLTNHFITWFDIYICTIYILYSHTAGIWMELLLTGRNVEKNGKRCKKINPHVCLQLFCSVSWYLNVKMVVHGLSRWAAFLFCMRGSIITIYSNKSRKDLDQIYLIWQSSTW